MPPATDDNESGSTEPTTPPADPKPENTAVSAPESPIKPNVEPAIDVEVVATDTTTASEPEPTPTTEPTQTVTIEELKSLSIQKIRKLAAQKGVGGSGKQVEIAARLASIVTRADLENLA